MRTLCRAIQVPSPSSETCALLAESLQAGSVLDPVLKAHECCMCIVMAHLKTLHRQRTSNFYAFYNIPHDPFCSKSPPVERFGSLSQNYAQNGRASEKLPYL